MTDTIGIVLTVADKGTVVVKKFSKGTVSAVKRMADRSIGHVKKLQKVFTRGLGGAIRGLGRRLTSLKTLAVTALVGWGLKRLVGKFEELSATQEKAEAGMLQAMKSMGRYTPELHAQLLNVASSLQKMTTFGDEATIGGLKFLLTYKQITDDLLPRTSKIMLDLAALMGGDVRQAANMLGKASMGMTGELRRVGITVDQETYKLHGYVGVLEEIAKQVEGQAAALRKTDAGGLMAFGNAVDDVKEKVGSITTRVKALIAEELLPYVEQLGAKLQKWIKSGAMEVWARNTGAAVIRVIADVIRAVGWMPTAFFSVKEAVHTTMMAIAALGSAAADVAAVVAASLNPYWAIKVAVSGFRETFPALAEMKDKIDKVGVSQYDAGEEASRSAQKYAAYGVKVEAIANKIEGSIKKATVVWEDGNEKIIKIGGTYKAVGEQAENAANKTVTKWKEAIVKIDGVWTNIKTKITVPAKVKATDKVSPVLKNIEKQYNKLKATMETPIKVKAQFKGKGSTETMLTEKIAEMQGKFGAFAGYIGGLRPQFTIDATRATAVLGDLTSMFQGLYAGQLQRAITAKQWLATVSQETGPYSRFSKEQAANRLAGAEAGLQYLRAEISRSAGASGGTARMAGGPAISGDIHIYVPESAAPQTPQDWREITRRYIVPELEAVGYA